MPRKASGFLPDRNKPVCDWDAIKDDVCQSLTLKKETWKQIADRLGLKENTLRAKASRAKWPVPTNIKRAVQTATKVAIAEAGVDWLKRGEEQREIAFQLSHSALKGKKKLTILNWKDAEIADKMARRAAGLENDNPISQTLISINEKINAQGDDNEVLEATIIEPTLALPPGEGEAQDAAQDVAGESGDEHLEQP